VTATEDWRAVTVTYIAVHSKTTDLQQRETFMRPNLGHLKNVHLVLLGLFRAHQLDIDIPDRIVAPLDGLKHVLDHVVRVLSGDPGSFLRLQLCIPCWVLTWILAYLNEPSLITPIRERFNIW